MKNKRKSRRPEELAALPKRPDLPPPNPQLWVERLASLCVDLLELCTEVTGTIDPAAAWLVAHAKDEVTLGVHGVRRDRPY